VTVLRGPARAIFEAAVERGEMRPDMDVDVALDLIYGPLYHRLFHGHAPLDENFVATVVDLVVAGVRQEQPLTVR
jgi:predicted nucleotidyltransferase